MIGHYPPDIKLAFCPVEQNQVAAPRFLQPGASTVRRIRKIDAKEMSVSPLANLGMKRRTG